MAMNETAKDLRQFLRLECYFNVDMMQPSSSSEYYISGKAKNISGGGICVLTDKPLPGKQELLLKFHFPQRDKPFTLKGRTVWSRQIQTGRYEAGIEFVHTNAEIDRRVKENVVNLRLDLTSD